MNDDTTMVPFSDEEKRKGHARRWVLGAASLVPAALLLAAKSAHAKARTVECLADLGGI